MKDFPRDVWEFEAAERGLPGFSVTSLDSLNWAWSDFRLLPSSARISYSSKGSSFKPLDCDQATGLVTGLWPVSWYFFMVSTGKSYPVSSGALSGAGEKLDQRVWSSMWRGNFLAVTSRSQAWGLLTILISPVPSLSLYFNHLHYKCPHKRPATFHPRCYPPPVPSASYLGFFSSILLERDIQSHLWPSEWISRCTPLTFSFLTSHHVRATLSCL